MINSIFDSILFYPSLIQNIIQFKKKILFGVGLHCLRLKSTEIILKSSMALTELDFKITEVDLSGVARGDPPHTPINFTEMDLTEVARGEPASTKLKATRLEIEVQRENQGIGHH